MDQGRNGDLQRPYLWNAGPCCRVSTFVLYCTYWELQSVPLHCAASSSYCLYCIIQYSPSNAQYHFIFPTELPSTLRKSVMRKGDRSKHTITRHSHTKEKTLATFILLIHHLRERRRDVSIHSSHWGIIRMKVRIIGRSFSRRLVLDVLE
jgi:hypothetical protein